jgi:predicted alpha/beta hydrolase
VQRDIQLRAEDGYALAATLYEPDRPNGIALQINSSANTPRRYYRAFAGYLAARGFVVLTYDYRGAFPDETMSLRDSPASLLTWGTRDQAAVTRYLREKYPQHAIALLGHSMGGQIVGLSPAAGELATVVLVASGHGYWRRVRNAYRRWRRALYAYLLGPLALRLLGYMPAFVMGGGGGPKAPGHARELLRFCRSPHFFCDERGAALRPHNGDIRVPLKHVLLADDEVVAPGAELDAREFFPNAQVETETLVAGRHGLARIGHFGFFRRSMPEPAWRALAEWIERAALAQRRSPDEPVSRLSAAR